MSPVFHPEYQHTNYDHDTPLFFSESPQLTPSGLEIPCAFPHEHVATTGQRSLSDSHRYLSHPQKRRAPARGSIMAASAHSPAPSARPPSPSFPTSGKARLRLRLLRGRERSSQRQTAEMPSPLLAFPQPRCPTSGRAKEILALRCKANNLQRALWRVARAITDRPAEP